MNKAVVDYIKENYVAANLYCKPDVFMPCSVTKRCKNGKVKLDQVRGYREIGIQARGTNYEWEIRELNEDEIKDALRKDTIDTLRSGLEWIDSLDDEDIVTMADIIQKGLLARYDEEERERINWVKTILMKLDMCKELKE